MARRSVTNDRYRVEQKGKTRKSASAAKPKREAGVAAGPQTGKKKAPAKKAAAKGTPRWGMGPSRDAGPRFESTPQMKQLRRYWWILIGAALALAVAMFFTNRYGIKSLDSVLLGLYAAALCGSLYLEFGPLRKARLAAMAEARSKSAKAPKAKTEAKKPSGAEPTAPAEDVPAAADAPKSLVATMLGFFGAKPKAPSGDNAPAVEPDKTGDKPDSEDDAPK
jgi:hypothetical protein